MIYLNRFFRKKNIRLSIIIVTTLIVTIFSIESVATYYNELIDTYYGKYSFILIKSKKDIKDDEYKKRVALLQVPDDEENNNVLNPLIQYKNSIIVNLDEKLTDGEIIISTNYPNKSLLQFVGSTVRLEDSSQEYLFLIKGCKVEDFNQIYVSKDVFDTLTEKDFTYMIKMESKKDLENYYKKNISNANLELIEYFKIRRDDTWSEYEEIDNIVILINDWISIIVIIFIVIILIIYKNIINIQKKSIIIDKMLGAKDKEIKRILCKCFFYFNCATIILSYILSIIICCIINFVCNYNTTPFFSIIYILIPFIISFIIIYFLNINKIVKNF